MNKTDGITFKLIRIAVDEKDEEKLNLDDLEFSDQGVQFNIVNLAMFNQ